MFRGRHQTQKKTGIKVGKGQTSMGKQQGKRINGAGLVQMGGWSVHLSD